MTMTHMLRQTKNDQSGAASMIIVVFMTIILTIITIGFLRLALNEQRVSTDDDLTSRAFYAAESGIEDARRAIRENLGGTLTDAELNADTCDVPSPARYTDVLSSQAEFDIGYSCMLIDFTPESIRSDLSSANQTRQYEINPVNPSGGTTNIGTIRLEWHMDAPAPDGDGDVGAGVNLRGGQTNIPRFGNWSFPAMMQVSFLNYPTGSFGRADIRDLSVWLSPGNGGGTTGNVMPGGNPNAAIDGEVLVASCANNNNDFACSMEFDMSGLPANRQLEMRLTNLYRPTSIEMTMETPGGAPLLFDEAQAVVDVTGRAGAVFRRVEAILDLSSPDLLPDFAIQAGSDICKDFAFTDDPLDFRGQPDTSCQF